jgi:hypothetical protein
MKKATITFLFLVLLLNGCASSPDPVEEKSGHRYKHTGDFMWKEVKAELIERYKIETEDAEKREIVTAWREAYHPSSNFGERHRLTVTLDGDEVTGIAVTAKEEAELNTEEKSPTDPVEADWEPRASDGAFARLFLTGLFSRLNPPKPQKEAEIR